MIVLRALRLSESGSPLEGLIFPRPAHSSPPGGTCLGGTPTGGRISWRCGRVTGSRTRINGLPFPLTVPGPRAAGRRPYAPAAGGPAARPNGRALAASRPARGRRARPGRLPRLRGACRAAARAITARPPGSAPSRAHRAGARLPAADQRLAGAGVPEHCFTVTWPFASRGSLCWSSCLGRRQKGTEALDSARSPDSRRDTPVIET